MLNRRAFTLSLVSALLLFSGCQLLGDLPNPGDGDDLLDGTIVVTGTVTFINLEGGAWVIRGDNGITYEPLNLPDAFLEEGLRIRARGTIRNDLASIVQVGPILDIQTVERL